MTLQKTLLGLGAITFGSLFIAASAPASASVMAPVGLLAGLALITTLVVGSIFNLFGFGSNNPPRATVQPTGTGIGYGFGNGYGNGFGYGVPKYATPYATQTRTSHTGWGTSTPNVTVNGRPAPSRRNAPNVTVNHQHGTRRTSSNTHTHPNGTTNSGFGGGVGQNPYGFHTHHAGRPSASVYPTPHRHGSTHHHQGQAPTVTVRR